MTLVRTAVQPYAKDSQPPVLANGATSEVKIHPGWDQIEMKDISCTFHVTSECWGCPYANTRHKHWFLKPFCEI